MEAENFKVTLSYIDIWKSAYTYQNNREGKRTERRRGGGREKGGREWGTKQGRRKGIIDNGRWGGGRNILGKVFPDEYLQFKSFTKSRVWASLSGVLGISFLIPSFHLWRRFPDLMNFLSSLAIRVSPHLTFLTLPPINHFPQLMQIKRTGHFSVYIILPDYISLPDHELGVL